MNNKNIVVLGGGTAGWLTALLVQQTNPLSNISLVESPEIGILGAGEGSTPHLVDTLSFLGLPLSEVISVTGATIKNGIKFTNWNLGKDKDPNYPYYYHNFAPILESLSMDTETFSDKTLNKYPLKLYLGLYHRVSGNEWDYGSILNENYKTPYMYSGINSMNLPLDQRFFLSQKVGIHFDASRLATYLGEQAVLRGIKHIKGTVSKVNSNSDDSIKSLVLEDGRVIELDFVFDCSGFNRLLIGKHFNSEWISHSDKLPVNTAIPFFLPSATPDNIPMYTESIAMKYGWMWKIPLQHRFGCGYVYDSSLTTEDEAKKEIEEYLGFTPEYPRAVKGSFKFNAGYYKTPWVKNCLAVGLASGFIEPLEATSIWGSLKYLNDFLYNAEHFEYSSKYVIEEYNKEKVKFNSSIADFLYLHYMGERDDTEFWAKFKEEKNHPEAVKNYLNIVENRLPILNDFVDSNSFGLYSWVTISHYLNKIPTKTFVSFFEKNALYNYDHIFLELRSKQRQTVRYTLSHEDFITEMRNGFND